MRFSTMTAVVGATILGLSPIGVGAFGADTAGEARAAAARIGRIVGASSECAFIAQTRVRAVADKTKALLGVFVADLPEVPAAYEKGLSEGRDAIGVKQSNCAQMENELTDLEHQLAPWLPDVPKTVAAVQPAPAQVAGVVPAPVSIPAPVAAVAPPPAPVGVAAPPPASAAGACATVSGKA